MLHTEVTLWDFLWILETIIILIAVYVAYKEGEKHGEAKRNRRYSLPPKTVSPEEFVAINRTYKSKRHYGVQDHNRKLTTSYDTKGKLL